MKGRNLGVRVGTNYSRAIPTTATLEHFPKPGWYEVTGRGGGGGGSGGNNAVEVAYLGEGGSGAPQVTAKVFLSSTPRAAYGKGGDGGGVGGLPGSFGSNSTLSTQVSPAREIIGFIGGDPGIWKSTDAMNYRGQSPQTVGGGRGGNSRGAGEPGEPGEISSYANYVSGG